VRCGLQGKARVKLSSAIFWFFVYKFWVGGLYFEESNIWSLLMFLFLRTCCSIIPFWYL